MRPVIGILALTGLVALNVQIYLLAERIDLAPERMAESISGVVVAQSQPEAIQRKLEELERLRASNAALQAVVASLSSSPSVGVERPAAANPQGAPADFSFFPVLPLPGESSPPPRVLAEARAPEEASEREPASEEEQEVKPEDADKAKPVGAGRLLVTPIRTRENGALVYLALDKVVRVVEVNGRLHGVDGYYEGAEEGLANLVIKGKRISLPLLVFGT